MKGFSQKIDYYTCNGCNRDIRVDQIAFSDRKNNIDLCQECYTASISTIPEDNRPNQRHPNRRSRGPRSRRRGCWSCGELGHLKRDCPHRNVGPDPDPVQTLEPQPEPEPENHPPITMVNDVLTTTPFRTPIANGWGYIHQPYSPDREWRLEDLQSVPINAVIHSEGQGRVYPVSFRIRTNVFDLSDERFDEANQFFEERGLHKAAEAKATTNRLPSQKQFWGKNDDRDDCGYMSLSILDLPVGGVCRAQDQKIMDLKFGTHDYIFDSTIASDAFGNTGTLAAADYHFGFGERKRSVLPLSIISKIVYSPGLRLTSRESTQLQNPWAPGNAQLIEIFKSIPPYSGILVLIKWSSGGAHYAVFARDGYNPNSEFDSNSCYLLDAQRSRTPIEGRIRPQSGRSFNKGEKEILEYLNNFGRRRQGICTGLMVSAVLVEELQSRNIIFPLEVDNHGNIVNFTGSDPTTGLPLRQERKPEDILRNYQEHGGVHENMTTGHYTGRQKKSKKRKTRKSKKSKKSRRTRKTRKLKKTRKIKKKK